MNFNQLRTHAGVNSQKHITKVNKKNNFLSHIYQYENHYNREPII